MNDAISSVHTEQRATEQALEELDNVAELATEAIRAEGDHSGAAKSDDAPAMTDEQREEERRLRTERAIKQASRQRKLGSQELERVYEGVMVVARDVTLNDPNIASSAQRFLALSDRTLHLLNRNGHRFIGAAELKKLQDRMNEMMAEYVAEAKQAYESTRQLLEDKKGASLDWIEPHYVKAVFSQSVNIKTRPMVLVADALMQWDKAIHNLCELEFNDEASASQANQVRRRERHLFSSINRFCIQTVIAMRNKSMPKREEAAVGS